MMWRHQLNGKVEKAIVADRNVFFANGLCSTLGNRTDIGKVYPVNSYADACLAVEEDCSRSLLVIEDQLVRNLGNDKISRFLKINPQLLIVVISEHCTREHSFSFLGSGAHGVIQRSSGVNEFNEGISLVLSGQVYVPASCKFIEERSDTAPEREEFELGNLTRRQVQILDLVSIGKSNKEIARSLDIAESTVKVHLRYVFKKLGIRNRTSAAALRNSGEALHEAAAAPGNYLLLE